MSKLYDLYAVIADYMDRKYCKVIVELDYRYRVVYFTIFGEWPGIEAYRKEIMERERKMLEALR